MDTLLTLDEALNSRWIISRVANVAPSSSGSLTAQYFWGASRIRAPLAPPLLSVHRKVDADAQERVQALIERARQEEERVRAEARARAVRDVEHARRS